MKRILLRLIVAALLIGLAGILLLGAIVWRSTPIPVLMYHHFIEEEPAPLYTIVSRPRLEEQMAALQGAGYTSITIRQLLDYVEHGTPLPKKPVLITIDDGYTSNLTLAAPVFEKYGMHATIFTIGINVGQAVYPHSGEQLDPPRFDWDEVRPWLDKGVLMVQSHTYDMHQQAEYGFSGREGVLPLEGESEEDYRSALASDISQAKEGLFRGLGIEMDALAFPFGLYTPIAVEELQKQGVLLTFTTDYGCDCATIGAPDTLRCMRRWYMEDTISGAQLIEGLEFMTQEARVDFSDVLPFLPD